MDSSGFPSSRSFMPSSDTLNLLFCEASESFMYFAYKFGLPMDMGFNIEEIVYKK